MTIKYSKLELYYDSLFIDMILNAPSNNIRSLFYLRTAGRVKYYDY